ncbi:MAG: carbohydrate kinase family protein [Nanoarchaeota archaeon]|nr:carbohydrate kinase family protein [Nanoarchaeota archaeon]
MYDVITFGSALVDTFVYTGMHEIKNKGKKLIAYNVGEKFLITETEQFTGGGGSNTAVSFARLGLKTGIITKLGNDSVGEVVLKELKKEKVDFLGKKIKGRSAFSVVLDSFERDRTILTYKAITNDIGINDFKLKPTKWLYFSSLMGESHKTQEKLAKIAKKKSIKIAYNPSSYQTSKGRKYLASMLKNTSLLVFNMEEARMISKKKLVSDILIDLNKLGPETICITDGKEAVYVYDGTYFYKAKPHKMKVLERTGAGDAFASGFVAGIVNGKKVEEAIRIGITNSESVIKYRGAKNKLLKYNEVLKILKKKPVRVEFAE